MKYKFSYKMLTNWESSLERQNLEVINVKNNIIIVQECAMCGCICTTVAWGSAQFSNTILFHQDLIWNKKRCFSCKLFEFYQNAFEQKKN